MPIQPDISARPIDLKIECATRVPPSVIYEAWTEGFDKWFAAPGTLLMTGKIDEPFFFETHFDGGRHAHYGRFLKLEPDKYMQLTWVTGNPGTLGAETILTVELEPHETGSRVTLTQAGFFDEESRDGHADAWPTVFEHLDNCLSNEA